MRDIHLLAIDFINILLQWTYLIMRSYQQHLITNWAGTRLSQCVCWQLHQKPNSPISAHFWGTRSNKRDFLLLCNIKSSHILLLKPQFFSPFLFSGNSNQSYLYLRLGGRWSEAEFRFCPGIKVTIGQTNQWRFRVHAMFPPNSTIPKNATRKCHYVSEELSYCNVKLSTRLTLSW